eukprot:4629748-Pleurochrysis_carterae.AAC.1
MQLSARTGGGGAHGLCVGGGGGYGRSARVERMGQRVRCATVMHANAKQWRSEASSCPSNKDVLVEWPTRGHARRAQREFKIAMRLTERCPDS